jgi:hypothetical protein
MSVSAGANRRRMLPIARNPGAFDLNVRPDTRQLGKQKSNRAAAAFPAEEPETLNIMPREILMAKNQNGSRYRDRHMLHCFSSANGLKADGETDDQILDSLVYAGVSVTGYDLHHDKQREAQGFVTSLGGLNTIINTGTHAIYPGDVLRVGLPHRDQKVPEGVPPEKKMFSVQPAHVADREYAKKVFGSEDAFRPEGLVGLDANMQNFLKAIRALMVSAGATDVAAAAAFIGDGGDAASVRANAQKVLNAALSIAQTRRRFEIGRALSFAPPGHDMDVVLM